MCDVAHAMLAEQVDGDARAAWARGSDLTPDGARDRLDEWLDAGGNEPPPGMDREQWELRRELGVA